MAARWAKQHSLLERKWNDEIWFEYRGASSFHLQCCSHTRIIWHDCGVPNYMPFWPTERRTKAWAIIPRYLEMWILSSNIQNYTCYITFAKRRNTTKLPPENVILTQRLPNILHLWRGLLELYRSSLEIPHLLDAVLQMNASVTMTKIEPNSVEDKINPSMSAQLIRAAYEDFITRQRIDENMTYSRTLAGKDNLSPFAHR